MMKAKLRAALVAAVVLSAAGAALPNAANANLTNFYYCYGKPPGQWCDGRSTNTYGGLHSWDWNQGWINGGVTTLCERVWKPSTGQVVRTSCAIGDYTASGNTQTCACLEAEVIHYNPGGGLNIYGLSEAN